MGMKSEGIFEDLRKRIESENLSDKKRKHFSKETRQEIEGLLKSGYTAPILSKQLGVSTQTFSNWQRSLKKTVPQPRKLTVVSDSTEGIAHAQVVVSRERTDVMLPNGIVLRNLALDVQTLALLKGF